jgi:hypothetical protein
MINSQIQPNRWSCLPTAFAMAMNIPVGEILTYIGHDGSEIIWPDLPEPKCRRAFHPQEIIMFAFVRGWAAIHFELNPQSVIIDLEEEFMRITAGLVESDYMEAMNTIEKIKKGIYSTVVDNEVLERLVIANRGVLVGTTENGNEHAVAWERGMIYDPNGTTYPITRFTIREFFVLKTFGQGEINQIFPEAGKNSS